MTSWLTSKNWRQSDELSGAMNDGAVLAIGTGMFGTVIGAVVKQFFPDSIKLSKKRASSDIRGWIGQAYLFILWLAGEPLTNTELDEIRDGGDRWTFHMRRTKKRLGATLWWVSVIATIVLYTIWFLKLINEKPKVWWKIIPGSLVYVFLFWLIPHVLGFW
jgi:glycerol uptake facilitator-like aquaporin